MLNITLKILGNYNATGKKSKPNIFYVAMKFLNSQLPLNSNSHCHLHPCGKIGTQIQ